MEEVVNQPVVNQPAVEESAKPVKKKKFFKHNK